VLALGGTRAIDAKKLRTWPVESTRQLLATASNLPFLAIAQGRTRFDWRSLGLPLAITAALTLAIVFWFHPQVIGAPRSRRSPADRIRAGLDFPSISVFYI
jgi:uncharacterized membrane protein